MTQIDPKTASSQAEILVIDDELDSHEVAEGKREEEALRQAEVRYRALFEGSCDAIMTLAPPSWRFTSGNPTAVRMFLASDEADFISRGSWEYSPGNQPDGNSSIAKAKTMIEAAVREGSHCFEWTHRRLNGEDFPTTVHFTRMEVGGQVSLLATVRDITAQKRLEDEVRRAHEELEQLVARRTMESLKTNTALQNEVAEHKRDKERLRASEEQWRALFDAANDGLIIFDPRTESFRSVNQAICQLLGYTPEALLACTVLDIISPADLPATLDDFRQLSQGPQSGVRREIALVRKDGSLVPVEIAGTSLVVAGERLILGAFRDIRGRKHAEDQLRKLSKAIEQSPASVVITNLTGQIEYVNPKFCAVTGYELAEVVGQNPRLLKSGHAQPAEYQGLWQRITSGEEWRGEFHNRKKSGELYWESAVISPIKDEQGQITHFLAVKEDITERKAAEEERKAIEVQLRHAQKLESIGRLAAGIAHEINTPTQYIGDNTQFVRDAFQDLLPVLAAPQELLAAIRENRVTPELMASMEALIEDADLEYLRQELPLAIEQSLQGVERVTKIVRAMKEFSHPGTTEKTQVDLNQAIESTLTVARNEWKYVAELVTEFDPQLPPVSCLPGEFNQVILNLVVNAAHAIGDQLKAGDKTCDKGTITVRTKLDGDWVEVRIGDSGTGIPEHARSKIFDPFFTTKAVGKGTGQGLAIARSVIVDKHGGEISFETEMGTGTEFIIRLPIEAKAKTVPA